MTCYLVESQVHLVHQVDVELAEEGLQLLWVGEGFSPQHLLTHDTHHGALEPQRITLERSSLKALRVTVTPSV